MTLVSIFGSSKAISDLTDSSSKKTLFSYLTIFTEEDFGGCWTGLNPSFIVFIYSIFYWRMEFSINSILDCSLGTSRMGSLNDFGYPGNCNIWEMSTFVFKRMCCSSNFLHQFYSINFICSLEKLFWKVLSSLSVFINSK